MISTMPYLEGWLLVSSETTIRSPGRSGISNRRVDTAISMHWAGNGWSPDINEAEYFERQDEALQFLREHREKMESLL